MLGSELGVYAMSLKDAAEMQGERMSTESENQPEKRPDNLPESQSESRILTARKEKVDQIRESGVNPYPNDFKRENLASQVHADMEGIEPEKVVETGNSYTLAGRVMAIRDFAETAAMDAVLICVPTPLNRYREPDLSYVERTAEAIAPHLRAGQLVVLESTTYPGTTAELLRPILERGGLKSGRDFFLAYSPEREDPGNPKYETATIPKVVMNHPEHALNGKILNIRWLRVSFGKKSLD